MNGSTSNLETDSSDYTPVYVIRDPGVTLAGSILLTEEQTQQPISDRLKKFYESSGNLDKVPSVNHVEKKQKSLLKKQEGGQIGNNLKLASFLRPKSDSNKLVTCESSTSNAIVTTNQSNTISENKVTAIPVSNLQRTNVQDLNTQLTNAKPLSTIQVVNAVKNLNVVKKLQPIQVHSIQNIHKAALKIPIPSLPKVESQNPHPPKKPPKVSCNGASIVGYNTKLVKASDYYERIKQQRSVPKAVAKEPVIPSKQVTVQLLKINGNYQSLTNIGSDDIKIVNKALQRLANEDTTSQEPSINHDTNTKIIYKIVSPKDLKLVGRKVVVGKNSKPSNGYQFKEDPPDSDENEEENDPKIKVTRSGRKVKIPNNKLHHDIQVKVKKKHETVVTCAQCSSEFHTLYSLQKHYEEHPTHIPANIHSSLFQCLLAIIKSGSSADRTNIFLQQLEQLIMKLKSLLPCLLKKVDGRDGKLCTINDDVGRLFGMTPGKYNLNMDALNCIKDENGYCKHAPHPDTKPSLPRILKHEGQTRIDKDIEDCARIKSIDQWPSINKRVWTLKKEKLNKRKRVGSESEQFIEPGNEDLTKFSNCCNTTESAININHSETNENSGNTEKKQPNGFKKVQNKKLKRVKYKSAHFDIRSSPIKPTAAVYHKFQISPDQMTNFVQLMRPLDLDLDRVISENNCIIATHEQTQRDEVQIECNIQHESQTPSLNGMNSKSIIFGQSDPENTLPPEFDVTNAETSEKSTTESSVNIAPPDTDLETSLDRVINSQPNIDILEFHKVYGDLNSAMEMPKNNPQQADPEPLPNLSVRNYDPDPVLQMNSESSLDFPSITDIQKGCDLNFSNSKDWTTDSLINSAYLNSDSNDKSVNLDNAVQSMNFLETLGNECIRYPEAEIRNNTDDFQFDFFDTAAQHNS